MGFGLWLHVSFSGFVSGGWSVEVFRWWETAARSWWARGGWVLPGMLDPENGQEALNLWAFPRCINTSFLPEPAGAPKKW